MSIETKELFFRELCLRYIETKELSEIMDKRYIETKAVIYRNERIDISKRKLTLEGDISKRKNELETILDKVYKDFPIYKFLGKLAKNKITLPEEVIISICNSYLKNKANIKNKWAWFIKTAQECWKNYNAKQNILDSAELNKLSQCKDIRQLIGNITKGV